MAISKKAGKRAPGGAGAAPKASSRPAKRGVAKADWREGFKKQQVGVTDMTLLSTVSNDAINDNLKKRFENREIYTYIGNVLISVNPFRDLGIYTDEILASYRGKNRLEMAPHVYAIAESAYYNMIAYHENQCVIISGESGAGKTEAAKRIMQYIAAVSGGSHSSIQEIKEMVLATNPLLESFGCAKTLRNNNSSRHGKYLEIHFNAQGEPIGANITNYLLEKGRIVGQIQDERNFHIFYQFTKAASAAQRETFGIQGPEAYAYTSQSNCMDVEGIDDCADFAETIKAMSVIGLSESEQSEIFRMLAIILWLGNVQFTENAEGNAEIADQSVPGFIGYLMEVDAAAVNKALTQRVMETQRGGRRGSIYDVPLNNTQATAVRDALSKGIYNNLFEWIVNRINTSMSSRQATVNSISVLDIYGFEIFDNNSFEQLCINYVNEKLQQIFIQLTLKAEQEEYVREQIKWNKIDYFNNKIVCDLIEEKRPPGVFAALNDACATAHADSSAADNSFVQRLGFLSSNPHFESRGSKFLIRHYAGDVYYNISGMTDKNKDALLKDILDLIGSSSNQFLQSLFPHRPDPNSKKRPPTAGDRIKTSANALVDSLMKCQPSYIRTIKPNQNRSPTEYDTKAILHQIKYLGLQENIRVRRAGFAYRNTFEKIVERFYLLSPATSYAGEYIWQGDPKSGCERILTDTGIGKDQWQMGVTKAFIKAPETLFALETMRDNYWHNMARRIQRAWRNYIRYKNEAATRIQRAWRNSKDSTPRDLRDYGHQVLAGRKERRRFSLLGMRRFMGDYLDVGTQNPSPLGEMLKGACGIGGSETVAFSSKIHLLVSRLGRSSKVSPRYLILTDKAMYIVVSQLKDQQLVTTLERKIALVTIGSVGLSKLRDDWIAINVNSSEEPDPVFSCYFKTELVTHLLQRTAGAINVNVGDTIEYSKKKDKKAVIKFVKDETVQKDDTYKSHTVSVASGESASSGSRPMPKKKPGNIRPITQGKLLKPGGPSKTTSKPRPKAQPLPVSARPAPAPAAAPKQSTGPSAATAAPPSAAVKAVPSAAKAAPPPPKRASVPPPPPPPPAVDQYKALYEFETDQDGEMQLMKDDVVEVVQKDDNGWWLVKKAGVEGWAPSNYLELIPAAKPKPAPPPAKRAPPPAPAATSSTASSATSTPKPALAAKPAPILNAEEAKADAAPIAIFPGMQPGGWQAALAAKKAAAAAAASAADGDGANGSATNGHARTGSAAGAGKPPAPAPAPKPKPAIAPKPGAPKIAAKPGGAQFGGAADLAAALAKRRQQTDDD